MPFKHYIVKNQDGGMCVCENKNQVIKYLLKKGQYVIESYEGDTIPDKKIER